MDPFCSKCDGQDKIQVIQSYRIPHHFDFETLKFEAVCGLFQVFHSSEQIIGAGNIEYKPEERTYFVYEIQSFWGQEGYELMMEMLRAAEEIDYIEGSYTWEECLL